VRWPVAVPDREALGHHNENRSTASLQHDRKNRLL
jgi:hypothetical protein